MRNRIVLVNTQIDKCENDDEKRRENKKKIETRDVTQRKTSKIK